MLTDFFPLLGGDFGIYQTVSQIKRLVNQALADPQQTIRLRAESLLYSAQERDEVNEIQNIFQWVEDHFHYVNDPLGVELVKNPVLIDQKISEFGEFLGDCDDISAYLASLLKSVGYPVKLVVVSPQQSSGYDYRHIFVRVWMASQNAWVALDGCARGKPLGWQVPNKKEREYLV